MMIVDINDNNDGDDIQPLPHSDYCYCMMYKRMIVRQCNYIIVYT